MRVQDSLLLSFVMTLFAATTPTRAMTGSALAKISSIDFSLTDLDVSDGITPEMHFIVDTDFLVQNGGFSTYLGGNGCTAYCTLSDTPFSPFLLTDGHSSGKYSMRSAVGPNFIQVAAEAIDYSYGANWFAGTGVYISDFGPNAGGAGILLSANTKLTITTQISLASDYSNSQAGQAPFFQTFARIDLGSELVNVSLDTWGSKILSASLSWSNSQSHPDFVSFAVKVEVSGATPMTTVSEPITMFLLPAGLAGLYAARRRPTVFRRVNMHR